MEYLIPVKEELQEIIRMKNRVKERVIKENLPIWKDGYPLDSMIEEDIENKEARIIKIDNKIVAYACFLPSEKEYPHKTFKKDNLYSFGRLMVDEGYVGKHIGDFFVLKMIEEAKTLGKNGLGITVDECNIKAYSLYKKHGFIKEGENQFPYAYLDILGLYW